MEKPEYAEFAHAYRTEGNRVWQARDSASADVIREQVDAIPMVGGPLTRGRPMITAVSAHMSNDQNTAAARSAPNG